MTKIILYPSQKPYQKFLEVRLNEQGWQVLAPATLNKTIQIIMTQSIDLIILDASNNLTEIIEILQTIQADKLSILSLVIGPVSTSKQLTDLLAAGATELIAGPSSWPEIWLRLKNLSNLERKEVRAAAQLNIGTHYYQEGLLVQPNKQVKLRYKENRILECLTKYQHRVLNRNELMRYVWNCPADYPSPDTIDVYIRRLRLKLGLNGKAIKTYRGFGYRWEPEE